MPDEPLPTNDPNTTPSARQAAAAAGWFLAHKIADKAGGIAEGYHIPKPAIEYVQGKITGAYDTYAMNTTGLGHLAAMLNSEGETISGYFKPLHDIAKASGVPGADDEISTIEGITVTVVNAGTTVGYLASPEFRAYVDGKIDGEQILNDTIDTAIHTFVPALMSAKTAYDFYNLTKQTVGQSGDMMADSILAAHQNDPNRDPALDAAYQSLADSVRSAGNDPSLQEAFVVNESLKLQAIHHDINTSHFPFFNWNKFRDGVGRQSFTHDDPYVNRTESPLVVDLNGDGIVTTSLTGSNVFFDLDGDGISQRTGWISPGDAFLTFDRNGNGRIDDGTELFGTASSNGFSILSQHDSNGDHVIDSNDADFAAMGVWRDVNGDGRTDDGELTSLQDAGIASVSLTTTHYSQPVTDRAGNIWTDTGKAITQGGTSLTVTDVWFKTDHLITKQNLPEGWQPSEEASLQPYLVSYGRLQDFHYALTNDPSLLAISKTALQQANSGDIGSFMTTMEQLLFKWAGVTYSSADPVGSQLKLVAALHDESGGSASPGYNNTIRIDEQYHRALDSFALTFLSQAAGSSHDQGDATTGPYAIAAAGISFNPEVDALGGDFGASATLIAYALELGHVDKMGAATYLRLLHNDFSGTDAEWKSVLTEALDATELGHTDRTVVEAIANSLGSTLQVLSAPGTVSGTYADEVFVGTDGADTITGSMGNDVLIGGRGDDVLTGGEFNDTYIFSRGDGADTIRERGYGVGWAYSSTGDKVVFDDVASTDVSVRQKFVDSGVSIQISTIGTTDSVTIIGQSSADTETIDQFSFSDGVVMTAADLFKLSLKPTSGSDLMYGSNIAEIIDGGAGDDVLNGGTNDTVIGGTGNDVISASGSIVVLNAGDGYDTSPAYTSVFNSPNEIRFGSSIAASQVALHFSPDTKSAVITYPGGSLTGNISTGFSSGLRMTFADGTSWSFADIMAKINAPTPGADVLIGNGSADTLSGGAGNDRIFGQGGDDVLSGGTGNDILRGATGNDTYVYALGDGRDLVIEGDGVDSYNSGGFDYIRLGSGITLANATFSRGFKPTDLVISFSDGGSITAVDGLDSYNGGAINSVVFADGTSLTQADVIARLVPAPSGSGMTIWNDGRGVTVNGGAGNDLIYGGYGHNVVYGGAGDDVIDGDSLNPGARYDDEIHGGDGNDTYMVDVADTVVTGDAGSDTLDFTAYYPDPPYKVDLSLASGQVSFYSGTAWTPRTWTGFENAIFGNGDDSFVGDANANTVLGGAGNDTISGGDGNDTLTGGAGTDILSGGNGNDTVVADLSDSASGGTGIDTLVFDAIGTKPLYVSLGNGLVQFNAAASPSSPIVSKTYAGFENVSTGDGSDTIVGDANANVIHALGGNDSLSGGAGNDSLYGEAGDDQISGGDGNDLLNGGDGHNILQGGNGDDSYVGGMGVDEITDFVGNSTISSGAGNDFIQTGSGSDVIGAGDGDDYIMSGLGLDTIDGGAGSDTLEIYQAGITIDLGMVAGSANMRLTNGQVGYVSNVENISGGSFSDNLTGNDLANALRGDGGADVLVGRGGNDQLYGGAGNDTIVGGTGSNILEGDDGDDILVSSGQYDTMIGGTGADTFHIAWGPEGQARFAGTVQDFVSGTDRIDLTEMSNYLRATNMPGLTYIDHDMFHGATGEVRYDQAAGRIQIDMNGDAYADLNIQILGSPPITSADYLF